MEPHASSVNVAIGKGSMFGKGKGLYAARDFEEGDIVIRYELKRLTFAELKALSPEDYRGPLTTSKGKSISIPCLPATSATPTSRTSGTTTNSKRTLHCDISKPVNS